MKGFLSDETRNIHDEQQAPRLRGNRFDEPGRLVVDELGWGLERRGVELDHFARAVDQQAGDTRSYLDHDHAVVERALDGREPEPRAQVDDRYELPAHLDETCDERRR